MTRYFLYEVSVEGFRGINNVGEPLKFRFNPVTVNSIHAPNGFGKSSVFEAICYAIYGTVPRLQQLPGTEHAEQYVVNRFHPGGVGKVQLVFTPDDSGSNVSVLVTADRQGVRTVSSPSGHPDPDSFLESLREDYALVDYRRFTEFVESSPLARGRSFASLVGLHKYSVVRQALEGLGDPRSLNNHLGIAAVQTEVQQGQRDCEDLTSRLLSAFNACTRQNPSMVGDPSRLISEVTSTLNGVPFLADLLENRPVTELDFIAAERALDEAEGGSDRRGFDILSKTVNALESHEITLDDRESLRALLTSANTRDDALMAAGLLDTRTLLKEALRIVSSTDWPDATLCPVCGSRSAEPIVSHIEEAITVFDVVQDFDAELVKLAKTSPTIAKLRVLEELACLGIPVEERVVGRIDDAIRSGVLATDLVKHIQAYATSVEDKRLGALDKMRQELLAAQASLPPSLVHISRLLSSSKQFCETLEVWETRSRELADKRAGLASLLRWKTFVEAAAATFSQEESRLADERVDEIQAETRSLFSQLMRGGPDVKPSMQRSRGNQQLDIKLEDFYGISDVSARALLSESYRNALAASTFLAAAKSHMGTPRYIILDDVTSSFDAGHQVALMELIRTRLQYAGGSEGLQFIILSHDSMLEKYFDTVNGDRWLHIKLRGLPPQGFMSASSYDADRLRKEAESHLRSGDVLTGGPLVRQYLEYKLGYVISKLAIPVPPDYAHRGDRRMLSTYIKAIRDAVELFRAAGRCVLEPSQLSALDGTHVPALMTNFVSHYETASGSPFDPYVLLGVLQSVDELVECFMYDDGATRRFYRRLDSR